MSQQDVRSLVCSILFGLAVTGPLLIYSYSETSRQTAKVSPCHCHCVKCDCVDKCNHIVVPPDRRKLLGEAR